MLLGYLEVKAKTEELNIAEPSSVPGSAVFPF